MTSPMLSILGTRLLLDGRPYLLQGLSFFNAIYNPAFNRTEDTRLEWLRRFREYGVNMLRIWCQWDYGRPYIDLAPDHCVFDREGALREAHAQTLCAILDAAAGLELTVEVVLFCQEQRDNLTIEAQERAAANVAARLRPYRHIILQIWNEKSVEVVRHYRAIKAVDPERIVTNSPGVANILGDDEQNKQLDLLTPHTVRREQARFWEIGPQQIAGLIARFGKPVIDDEPARTGLAQFGGIPRGTEPWQHIEQIQRVRAAGGYHVYHHDMFQNGYGHPSTPPNGIPNPEFPFHREVFAWLQQHQNG